MACCSSGMTLMALSATPWLRSTAAIICGTSSLARPRRPSSRRQM
jgi:hypothetical protein